MRAPAVGSDYCSRICCTNTMKNAIRIKMLNPNCQVVVLYKDIITYGFREQFYTEARRAGRNLYALRRGAHAAGEPRKTTGS